MTSGTSTPVTPETVLMGVTPASVDVEPGDTLQFSNNSALYPKFEVVFQGSSPNDLGLTFPGTTEINVPVTKDGEFTYIIRHHSKKGHCVDTGAFSVRSCTGGC
jgi:plastocyanin